MAGMINVHLSSAHFVVVVVVIFAAADGRVLILLLLERFHSERRS